MTSKAASGRLSHSFLIKLYPRARHSSPTRTHADLAAAACSGGEGSRFPGMLWS